MSLGKLVGTFVATPVVKGTLVVIGRYATHNREAPLKIGSEALAVISQRIGVGLRAKKISNSFELHDQKCEIFKVHRANYG